MNLSAQEACQNLVDALAEARAVNAEQKQHTTAARQKAEGVEEQVLSMLKAQQADVASADAQQQLRQYYERTRSRLPSQDEEANRLLHVTSLRLRWETALCDSQLALMRLYAYTEAQAGAEQIAEMLRTLRLLQVKEVPRPRPMPPLPTADIENASQKDQQRQNIGMALDFIKGMSGYTEQVQQSYQERSDQTQTLLKQIYEEAEALAQRLKA